jgi:hypothetical protein
MASSKKYGYQLRGEKLSLCELDITGSGSGLNYSYEENSGLDISTDPSAWKSPLTTITDGLQLEYLSNEFIIDSNSSPVLSEALSLEKSRMDNIDDIYDFTAAAIETFVDDETTYNLSHPLVFEQVSTSTPYGNVLKISKLESVTQPDGMVVSVPSTLSLCRCDVNVGERYRVSIDINMNCDYYFGENREYMPELRMRLDPDAPSNSIDFQDLSPALVNNISPDGRIIHPNSSPGGSFHTGYANFSFEFITTSDHLEISLVLPNMGGTVGDDRYIKIDNLKVSGFGETKAVDGQLSLPSYAQKALLDYVRAQDAYENGDLEKWDFFMKQFRSKLERWEDSRITGPRVLGPHGPSSIT